MSDYMNAIASESWAFFKFPAYRPSSLMKTNYHSVGFILLGRVFPAERYSAIDEEKLQWHPISHGYVAG